VLGRIGAKHKRATYIGRPAAASPATGLAREHKRQQDLLIDTALTLSLRKDS
jgi:2-oxoglutarate dehydrogenase E1 component